MRTYKVLSTQEELDRYLVPVLKANGSEIPAKGAYVAAVEMEGEEIVAYQILQMCIFLEGLWSKDSSSHLLRVWHLAGEYARNKLGATGLMTMTRKDDKGNKIGRLAEKLGFTNLNLNVYRKVG